MLKCTVQQDVEKLEVHGVITHGEITLELNHQEDHQEKEEYLMLDTLE